MSTLGMTVGDAVRRLENHPYIVICHKTREHHAAANMRQAMALAKSMSRRMPGHSIHIHLPKGAPTFGRNSLVARIKYVPGKGYSVRFNQQLRGLGDALTDWACDNAQYTQSWRERVNSGLDSGAQAAVAGAAIAALVGGLLKRPFIGAVVGAGIGYGTHAIWTAPQRVS
jgi:hypothetical protein